MTWIVLHQIGKWTKKTFDRDGQEKWAKQS